MLDTNSPELDVEPLMARIREEAERERQGLPVGGSIARRAAAFQLPRLPEATGALPRRDRYTLGELLDRHDEDFLRTAYQALLGRRPDADGISAYLSGLRAGQLSKLDILGRLRFSPEGRQHRIRVDKLLPVWLAHSAYRIPVLGPLLAWLSALVRLPRLVGQWSRFENFVMFQHGQQNAQINAALAQLEAELRHTRQRLADCEARLAMLPPPIPPDPPFAKGGNRRDIGGEG